MKEKENVANETRELQIREPENISTAVLKVSVKGNNGNAL